MTSTPLIHSIFEPISGTWQYLVADPQSSQAAIINPVLDFDSESTGAFQSTSADEILELVRSERYTVAYILETHDFTSHPSAAKYIQHELIARDEHRPDVCIAGRTRKVVKGRFGIDPDGTNKYDQTFSSQQTFTVGELPARVLRLDGRPDEVSYMIGDKIFTRDTILNADRSVDESQEDYVIISRSSSRNISALASSASLSGMVCPRLSAGVSKRLYA